MPTRSTVFSRIHTYNKSRPPLCKFEASFRSLKLFIGFYNAICWMNEIKDSYFTSPTHWSSRRLVPALWSLNHGPNGPIVTVASVTKVKRVVLFSVPTLRRFSAANWLFVNWTTEISQAINPHQVVEGLFDAANQVVRGTSVVFARPFPKVGSALSKRRTCVMLHLRRNCKAHI